MNIVMARIAYLIGVIFIFAACQSADAVKQESDSQPVWIVFSDWEDDIPQTVLDEFTVQTGIPVRYQAYQSDMEAEQDMLSGKANFDVVAVDNDIVPVLIQNNLLHAIRYSNVPNFRYISINFRDLVFDPENRYSIPFNWGTTGIIMLQSGDTPQLEKWADLWTRKDELSIGMRKELMFDNVSITKIVNGYSVNECAPEAIYKVYQQLDLLVSSIVFVESDSASAVNYLENGEIDALIGWSDDVFEARARGMNVVYILPKEGTLVWGDSFVIPESSSHPDEAEQFINFLLEPRIAAEILLHNNYASANETVKANIPEEYLTDSIIYPDEEVLRHSQIYMPVTEACYAMQSELWQQFVEDNAGSRYE